MSLQRSVRLGLTHFTLTRLVAHFLYTLINIRYAWGLPCLTASEDMSLLPFFGAKVWRCSLNHDKDRRLSRFHDNFRGRLPHLVTPDEQATQHGYSTEILAEFLAWRCACHHIMHRKRAILDTSYSMTQTSVLTHTYINSTLGHHDYSQCLRRKRKMTLIRRDADIFLLYISLS